MAVTREPTGVGGLDEALAGIVQRVAEVARADVVVARLADESGGVTTRAVHATSAALRAELEGSRLGPGAVPAEERDELLQLPAPLRRVAERFGASGMLQLPVRDGPAVIGSLELLRRRGDFDEQERRLARAAADEIALARFAFGDGDGSAVAAPDLLALAGDALAAASDETRAADQVATLAAEAAGARACLIWRYEAQGPVLAALSGTALPAAPAIALEAAQRAQEAPGSLAVDRVDASEGPSGALVTLQLGEPPQGALQLLLAEVPAPGDPFLDRLGTFAVRAAHALRAGDRRRTLAVELERSRALLTIVGQAIAQLSLTHTLDTAVEHVSELLGAERLAVYLAGEDEQRLEPAAERELTGPHARVAERLLELLLGPARGRGLLAVPYAASDPRLAGVSDVLEEIGIEAAVAVPLRVRDDLIGLLAVYPDVGRELTENEESLLLALAAQLAVAVQNARLHEETKRLSTERTRALEAELEASRRLRVLYEISRSFSESLSLERTLEAVARTIVDLLEVDAAALRMPDERGTSLVPVAMHVREERMTEAMRAILSLPQPLTPVRPTVFRGGQALLLDPRTAKELGPAHEPLVPFLEKGSSAAIIPLATQTEILGTLTLVSLDPDRPLAGERLEVAASVAGQAALALDNARLYQQQKQFADSMQHSLLPSERPKAEGLDVGAVYASSARMDVGGDVFDFLELGDGRLAVVLGDVTGHGVDAAADMAMAKFVFRSLAREHPEPGDFLAAANEIVLEETGEGKFITLLYLAVDGRKGELVCASAGHPPPRIVPAGGSPVPLRVRGLALGIAEAQTYAAERVRLEPGDAVVLYTDGLPEARRDGELYGEDRLDAVLASNASLPAEELAKALVEDCRAFAGELADDCAVVVVKRV
ncbi:MAG TPA: SpoIIE family protein phosphatase [Gaiellaceae bacterium]|nr:SpoIIE family protein phosphatase [Gaiellaceae bacterium]